MCWHRQLVIKFTYVKDFKTNKCSSVYHLCGLEKNNEYTIWRQFLSDGQGLDWSSISTLLPIELAQKEIKWSYSIFE